MVTVCGRLSAQSSSIVQTRPISALAITPTLRTHWTNGLTSWSADNEDLALAGRGFPVAIWCGFCVEFRTMTGVPASPSGHSGQAPEPASGLGHTASVLNAAQVANDSDFLVEADIPIPPTQTARVARYGAPKYPWDAMEIGDSFLVPGDGSAQQQIRVNTASNVRAKRHPGEAYVTRVTDSGVRVWRVAPALAAGAQSAETNEDLAQSEGRQSGPKGNAHTPSPNLSQGDTP
jgi:hypothetical protein